MSELQAPTYRALAEDTPETWANSILYRLAQVMDYSVREDGIIEAEPDEILAMALGTLWRMRDRTT